MYKQIILLFIIIFSALGGLSMFSQVVIKDEIVLDEKNIYETENPDEENLTMPFYGKVQGTVPWGSVYWNHFKRVEIEAGGQIVSRGCPCNGCGVFNGNWVINNLPAATPVVVRAYTHCVDGEFVEGETRLINTVANEYSIEVFSYNFQIWTQATTLKFIETTPPGCYVCSGSLDEACEECEDDNKLLPIINLVNAGNGFDNIDVCKDSTAAAGFNIVSVNALVNYNFVLNACFNKQLQRWWFNITGDTLHFRYILDFCIQNIEEMGGTLIENYQNFPSEYGCENILRDIENHFSNPVEISIGGYVLKSILETHESKHLADFAVALNAEKEILLQQLKDEEVKLCEDFGSIEEAKRYWVGVFGTKLMDMWDRADAERDHYTAEPDYEINTHESIRPIIDQIRKDALCYWGCEYLDPEIECPEI